MSKKRMAGEALSDPNFAAREKLSNDPTTAAARAAKVGEGYDVSGYSDKEISMALQGDSFGDDDYTRLTGKSMGEDDIVEDTPEVVDDATPEPEATPAPSVNITFPDNNPNPFIPEMIGPGGSGMNVYQDNDQSSVVEGDNNVVTQNQDNSVRSYNGQSSWKDAWMKDYFS